jgi:hypothetical protein
MSDGGIGDGIEFWATINIRGKLDKVQLKKVTTEIRQLLSKGGVNGDIVHSARLTADENPIASINIKESTTHLKKRKAKKKN